MSQFGVHTKQTAPEQSVKLLEQAESAFGFVPNLLGVFAESPAVLKAYLQLGQIFDGSSFSPVERQVAILAVSRFKWMPVLHGGSFRDCGDAESAGAGHRGYSAGSADSRSTARSIAKICHDSRRQAWMDLRAGYCRIRGSRFH
jgi:hypothetical protein